MEGERPELDWLLLGRYALLIALCELIPVPLLDGWVENRLRRRMVRLVAEKHGATLEPTTLSTLADASSGGCLGLLWAVLLWPVKKLLKTVVMVFQAKTVADRFSEALHRALLIEEGFELGLLPAEPKRVREAMDAALTHVDTRPIERKLLGTLKTARHELNAVVWETVAIARGRVRGEATEAVADAVESDVLPKTHELGRVLSATLRVSGLVPELVHWFRAELGLLQVEPKLSGPISPQVLALEGSAPPDAAPLALVEDAVEVKRDRSGGD